MAAATIKSVQCISPAGLHRMAYKEWGDSANPRVLVCVHGVTRVGDDFDALAANLSDRYRVVCPDVVGRGRSGRLRNPVAMQRIAAYIAQELSFDSFEQGKQFVREVSASFGAHTDAQWNKLAADVLRQNEQGRWVRHYDMGLAEPLKQSTPESAKAGEAALWAAYDAIHCPTLLVRGANSDLLSRQTVEQMLQRGPKPQFAEIADTGHAPTFIDPAQIAIARRFLLGQ